MTARRPDEPEPPGQTSPARPGSSAPIALYDIDPDTIVALVSSCPAVAGLTGGPFGAAATYLPGRRVPGVQITPTAVQVHIVARYGIPVSVLAGQVRQVLAGQVLGRPVDIVVEDLEDLEDLEDPAGAATVTPASVTTDHPPLVAGSGLDVGWPPATLPPPDPH